MPRFKQTVSSAAPLLIALFAFSVHAQTAVIRDGFERNFDGWTNYGDNAVLTAVRGEGYNSSRAMKVTGRKSSEDGAASLKGFYIEDGVNYNYSVYVRHTAKSAETFNLTVQYTMPDGKDAQVSKVIATAAAQPNQWTQLAAAYATPSGSVKPTFIITTNGAVDFYFDEFVATGRSASLAKVAAPMAGDGLKDRYASHFRVGNLLNGTTANNAGIRSIILKDYNSVSAENEHKPDATISRTRGTERSSNTNILTNINTGAAAIMNFCAQNNIPMRGHVLTWHGQSPGWFFLNDMHESNWERYRDIDVREVPWATPAVMNQRLESYIKNLFERYANEYPDLVFYAYDVVNEAVDGNGNPRPPGFDHNGAGGQTPSNSGDSPWVAVYGDNRWIETAFTYARQYAPPYTKLFYNDYNEWQRSKRDGIIDKILKPLLAKGVLDGMGMQTHISANPNDGWNGESIYFEAMEKYGEIDGMEVQITEMDVSTDNGRYAAQQPDRYRKIFERAIAINAKGKGRFTAICIWTPSDAHTWIGSSNTPALHDRDNNPKPAYTAVAGVVPQSQWGDGNNPTFAGGGIITPPPPIEPDANGFFFYHTFEDGTEQGWRGRGAASAANTRTQQGSGSRSLAVTGRTASWHGVEYGLNTAAFAPGSSYSFSALAMYTGGEATDVFKFTMSYTLAGETVFDQVDLKTAQSGQWIRLASGSFPIPAGASNLILYVEMPDNETGSFFVDDIMGGIDGAVVVPDADGYFFHHTFEGSATQDWAPRFGGGTTVVSADHKANGSSSLYISGRTESYHGPAYNLSTAAFVPGGEYSFSVIAMYAEGPATASFKFTLQYSLEGEAVYAQVALLEDVTVGNWVMLENPNFAIPAGATNLVLYVEMPDNPTTAFYIDDAMGGMAGAAAPGREGVSSISGRQASAANRSARPLVAVRGRILNISSPNNSVLTIKMIDTRGKVRAKFNAAGSARFNLSTIPAGKYFVDVKGAGVRQTLPVVVK